MGLFQALVGGPAERKTIDATNLLLQTLLGAPSSKAGVSVNVNTALRVATVFACCRVLAEDIAQLPLKLMREREDGTKEVARNHPTHRVIYRTPNEWMDAFQFRETLMYHALLAKGGFAVKNVVQGKVVELYPVQPGNVTIRQSRALDVSYVIEDGNGTPMEFPRSQIFHLRGPSWDGVNGMEVVQQAREAIGLSIATEETQARLHSNGVRPSGIVSMDGELKPATIDRLREQINQIHQGAENAGKIMVLDKNGKFSPFTMTGVDAQHLETRKHQVEEICRAFRLYPQMVFHSDKTSTYASAELFSRDYVKFSLGPWIARWEQAIYRDLVADGTREDYYPKFFVDGFLRGDSAARSAYFKAALGTSSSPGWMSPNDVRRLEDMDPGSGPGMDKVITAEDMAGKPAPPPVDEPADGRDAGDDEEGDE